MEPLKALRSAKDTHRKTPIKTRLALKLKSQAYH